MQSIFKIFTRLQDEPRSCDNEQTPLKALSAFFLCLLPLLSLIIASAPIFPFFSFDIENGQMDIEFHWVAWQCGQDANDRIANCEMQRQPRELL